MRSIRMMIKQVIAGGYVIDGVSDEGALRDVYVVDGIIDSVQPVSDSHGDWHVCVASGLCIAPGFIDVHSHADNAPFLTRHGHKQDPSRRYNGSGR